MFLNPWFQTGQIVAVIMGAVDHFPTQDNHVVKMLIHFLTNGGCVLWNLANFMDQLN